MERVKREAFQCDGNNQGPHHCPQILIIDCQSDRMGDSNCQIRKVQVQVRYNWSGEAARRYDAYRYHYVYLHLIRRGYYYYTFSMKVNLVGMKYYKEYMSVPYAIIYIKLWSYNLELN